MSKGTILYVGAFELPDKNAAAHRVLSNGKILRELGYNVVFIDVDRNLNCKANLEETRKKVQGFDCWSLVYPKSYKDWIEYLTSISKIELISRYYQNVEKIIAYNYQAVALYRLKKHCNKRNIKIIADVTEWYETKGENIFFKIIKGSDTLFRMRIIQKKLDGLIVISKYLEKYYNNHKNVIKLPPLVDLEEEKWNIDINKPLHDKLMFVYSGSPGKNKDKINVVIETLYTLKAYNNYIFNIIGLTKEQYINYYPKHEKILSVLKNRIFFLGRIPHKKSIKYLKESDFSIFIRENTRVTEAGFPTKLVESISCGTPVITNYNSDVKDFIKTGQNGILITNIKPQLEKVLLEHKKSKMRILNTQFYYPNYKENTRIFLSKL